jgi:hypothetical protein
MERPSVEPETGADAGQWIRPRLLEWWSLPDRRMPVGAIVPTGFEDYARVFHPAYQMSGDIEIPVSWCEVASLAGVRLWGDTAWQDIVKARSESSERLWSQPPRQGTLLLDQTIALIAILRPHTMTPGECQFAVWDGYGGLDYDARWPGAARLELPGRGYVVLKGPLEAVTSSFDDPSFWQSPNLWWPQDRSWCVATEIDYSWSYVGGSKECIQRLLGNEGLESLRVRCEDPAPESPVGAIRP